MTNKLKLSIEVTGAYPTERVSIDIDFDAEPEDLLEELRSIMTTVRNDAAKQEMLADLRSAGLL